MMKTFEVMKILLALAIIGFLCLVIMSLNWDAESTAGFMQGLHKLPTRMRKHSSNDSTKYILYYSGFFSREDWFFGFGANPFQKCPVSNCYVTNNRSLISDEAEFDAILFHCGNLQPEEFQPPMSRLEYQRYIFFCQESPVLYNRSWHHPSLSHFFNWTMTYRRDSDIYAPYGMIESNMVESPPVIKKKPKMVAWMVSHCDTDNKREAYVEELSRHIEVDILGKCGKACTGCPEYCEYGKGDNCTKYVIENYMFYLAFENSHCNDYVTEKFWRTLVNEMVPIVYGGANYTALAPPHSYINIEDFSSPKELAKYLLRLNENIQEYESFFEWRRYFKARTAHSPHFMCKLCEKLNKDDLPKQFYHNIGDWWTKDQCPVNQIQYSLNNN